MVERKLHRKGAGRLVVLKLLNLLRSFPFVNLVKLDTSQHTTAFYENFGFEKYAFIENYYTEGLHRYDMKMDWNDAKLAEVSDQLADLEATQRLQREGDV
jgi:ribosomal protein S18 acetylase RimI-like enzyme